MKVRIAMGRSVREYATVIVEADSVEAAQAYVEQLLASGGDSEAYCDLVNAGSWHSESDSVSDEAVTDAEEYEDEDEEADVVVPSAASERAAARQHGQCPVCGHYGSDCHCHRKTAAE